MHRDLFMVEFCSYVVCSVVLLSFGFFLAHYFWSVLFYKPLAFYYFLFLLMLPPLPFCCFVPCVLSSLFAEIKPTLLGLLPQFYKPKQKKQKNLGMMQAATLWLWLQLPWSTMYPHRRDMQSNTCHHDQSETGKTCMRNWCRPAWDCQGSGVRWVQALSTVRALGLSRDCPDPGCPTNRPINQHLLTYCLQNNQNNQSMPPPLPVEQ